MTRHRLHRDRRRACVSRRDRWRCRTAPSSSPRCSASGSRGSHPTAPPSSCARSRVGRTVSPSGPMGRCTCATTAVASRRSRSAACSFLALSTSTATRGGLIQRIDHDGRCTDLYTNCAGRPLRSPNDLVMDGHGGFYFTDYGIHDLGARTADLSALYYARCDGSDIHEVAYPVQSPNGVGLSPDGDRAVLRRDVHGSRLPPADRRAGRARIAAVAGTTRGRCCAACPGCSCSTPSPSMPTAGLRAGTLINGGITSISPDGAHGRVHRRPVDPLTTNSASAGPTCAPPTSRCRRPAGSCRWSGRVGGCGWRTK